MAQKVLYIVTKSNFGGAQRYVYDLAVHPPAGWEAVVAAGGTGILFEKCTAQQVRCASVQGLVRDVGLFSEVRALLSLSRLIRTERPDVVHLNSSKAGGLGALVARFHRIPRIVFTIHGLPQDEPRSRISKYLIGLATWATCILSHRVICVSNDNYRRVVTWYGCKKKTSVIHNGLSPFVLMEREIARQELRLPQSGFVIGIIAELHKNKGIAYALRALVFLPSMTLVCISDGEEREHLEKLARELGVDTRTIFTGFIHEARQYLKAFDVVCLPSVKEGLPYVLLEALYAGVPIVASDLPGIREVVGSDVALVPPRDVQALVRALQTLPPAPSKPHFTFEEMLQKTHALYIRQAR